MSAIKGLVKRTGSLVDRVIPPPAGVTILIYHRVGGGTASEVDLDPDMFERHLEHLAEHHRVLSLDDAVTELTAGTTTGWATAPTRNHGNEPDADPRRGVVITFDDGTRDFTDIVVPALDKYGLPATLYAATRFIDTGEQFPWGAPPTTWPALCDALAGGNVTIGSHTDAHWLLDRLDDGAIDDDLDRSIESITDAVGIRPRHFAYPKAVPGSPAAEIAVRRRFDTASLAASRVNRPGRVDLHRLWRTPIQRSDGFDMFAQKADGGLRLEGELRSLTARTRYRGDAR
jgi:peptidoglycan/xylan/chitin deacetylase (PgdA/CDA1 family)